MCLSPASESERETLCSSSFAVSLSLRWLLPWCFNRLTRGEPPPRPHALAPFRDSELLSPPRARAGTFSPSLALVLLRMMIIKKAFLCGRDVEALKDSLSPCLSLLFFVKILGFDDFYCVHARLGGGRISAGRNVEARGFGWLMIYGWSTGFWYWKMGSHKWMSFWKDIWSTAVI